MCAASRTINSISAGSKMRRWTGTVSIWHVLVCCVVGPVSVVRCFNFEIRDPVVKQGAPGSYFGYSVALHQVVDDSDRIKENWLLVGAPLGQNLQPETHKSGALFKCPIDSNQHNCQQIETDGRRSDDEFDYGDEDFTTKRNITLAPPTSEEIKNGQWLGVSVRSQGSGGKAMVCAHRYISGRNLSSSQHGFGLCYSYKNSLEFDSAVEPCKGRSTTSEHLQFGYCQAGTSLALLEDGTALIGAPGPFTWRGTIFAQSITNDFLNRDKNVYLGPLNDKDKPIAKYSYLGMSVTGGQFGAKKKVLYATGAPRAAYNGKVYIFNKTMPEHEMSIVCNITGNKFASNFGYEVLAADFNNDGIDELVVAAPFEFDDTTGGAVYIYTNVLRCRNDFNLKESLRLTGLPESRFGFSMTSLGDINKDGYVDLAIGAPYEGSGAIYIYLGGPKGINKIPSQKIQHHAGLSTIGYSLSGGIDMDNNGFPDLLTGAYNSDKVIMYRARKIIDINIKINNNYKEYENIDITKPGCQRDRNSPLTCFTFESCIILKSKPVEELRFKLVITADINKGEAKFSRVLFDPVDIENGGKSRQESYFSVVGKDRHCMMETVYLRENVRDILSPIKFQLNYTLDNNKINSPILNQSSIKYFDATFQKNCGDDEKCQSEIYLDASLKLTNISQNHYTIILGEDDEINLDVRVENEGESAYEAQLFIMHNSALSYIALNDKLSNVKCTVYNATLVICTLGNPLVSKKNVTLGIRFEGQRNDLKHVDQLNFDLFVNSTSEELSQQNRITLVADVVKQFNIALKSSATSYTVYGGKVKGESAIHYFDEIGSRVTHRYQVINEGPWHAEDMKVYIDWPLEAANDRDHGKWLLYLEDLPTIKRGDLVEGSCNIDPREINILKLTHRLGVSESQIGQLVAPPPPNYNMTSRSFDSDSHLRNIRRRRDVEMVVKADTLIGEDGTKRRVVKMNCGSGKAKCITIECNLKKLGKDEEATIEIRSRLWNSTFVEDYSNVDYVEIVSTASITYGIPIVHKKSNAVTIAYPEAQPEGSLAIWVYIVATIAGILILLILILILWKCGFFKRNRVTDHTLSGNLQRKDEQDSLLSAK